MNHKRNRWVYILILTIFILTGLAAASFMVVQDKEENVATGEADDALVTNRYETSITIQEDSTYLVEETIDCSFLEERHGIYRYIPYKQSVQVKLNDGTYGMRPVYADIDMKSHNEPYSRDEEDNSVCYQFGDEEVLVTDKVYQFSYSYKPRMENQITMATYNVFPTGWRSTIPAGSSFSITFPKEIDFTKLNFTYGPYGSAKDADDVVDFVYNGNTVTGTLKEELPVFSGVSFYIDLPNGYFNTTADMSFVNVRILIVAAIVAVFGVFSYIFFGRSKRVRQIACYVPPKGADSALAGYLLDGNIQDKDILSLVTYLACKGMLKIKQDEDKVSFIKSSNLPEDTPEYIRTIFDGIFGKFSKAGDEVKLEQLQNKFYDKMAEAKKQLQKFVKKEFGGVFTVISEVMRAINLFLFLGFLIFFVITIGIYSSLPGAMIVISILFVLGGFVVIAICCDLYNKWYVLESENRRFHLIYLMIFTIYLVVIYMVPYQIGVARYDYFDFTQCAAVSMGALVISGLCTAFMRKRSKQSYEYMNRLIGYREYIQSSNMEGKQKAFAANPELYYEVLPYATVLGLSEEWMMLAKEGSFSAPAWYIDERPIGRSHMGMDCLLFMGVYQTGIKNMENIMTSVPEGSANSGSGFTGGSGGISGGGFGGGGGGSW